MKPDDRPPFIAGSVNTLRVPPQQTVKPPTNSIRPSQHGTYASGMDVDMEQQRVGSGTEHAISSQMAQLALPADANQQRLLPTQADLGPQTREQLEPPVAASAPVEPTTPTAEQLTAMRETAGTPAQKSVPANTSLPQTELTSSLPNMSGYTTRSSELPPASAQQLAAQREEARTR
jgi:hypothetical protein